MHSSSLSIDDLNRFLHDMEFTSSISMTVTTASTNPSISADSHKSHSGPEGPQYDTFFDGESVGESEFVYACRLIVNAHRAAEASAIALDDDYSSFKNNKNPDTVLASLIGNVAPAAAAVIGESPNMSTPYLDPSLGGTPYTPFTPATAFTPCFQGTSPYIECMDTINDISVANYLSSYDNNSWTCDGAAAFNGDPSQLMLDKCKSELCCSSNGEQRQHLSSSSDALFPPLPPQNEEIRLGYPEEHHSMQMDEQEIAAFMDDIFGFDSNGSTSNDHCDNNPVSDGCEEGKENKNTKNDNSSKKSSRSDDNHHHEHSTTQAGSSGSSSKKRKHDREHEDKSNKRRSTQNTERRFECPICHIKFSRRYNLGTHISTHDKDRIKKFSCMICGKGFDRKHDRNRHVATVHHGERSYSCNECGSSFSRKDALTRHLIQKHGYDGVV